MIQDEKMQELKSQVGNNQVGNQQVGDTKRVSARLRVYRKKSKFKNNSGDEFWYSATRQDGASVICKFRGNGIPEQFKNEGAFEIDNIIGTFKREEVNVKGEVYINYTYYINSCDFYEIEGEPLPL